MDNSCSLFSASPFKSFADFIEIEKLAGSETHVTAKEKVKSQPDDPCYENKWYLLLRQGLYRAQVEKAMSEIYHYFLGYGTDIEILKNSDNYFNASRGIANYTPWHECVFKLQIKTDGSLVLTEKDAKKETNFPVFNLGTLCALTDFFNDNDPAPGNFGLQFVDEMQAYRAFKIDSEKSLPVPEDENEQSENSASSDSESSDDECLSEKESIESEIKQDSILFLKKDITEAACFKNEKEAMLNQIASTDFFIIEQILRKNITSTRIESSMWIINNLAKQKDKERFLIYLNKMTPEEMKKTEIDWTIEKLREQHFQLRKERNLAQTYRS